MQDSNARTLVAGISTAPVPDTGDTGYTGDIEDMEDAMMAAAAGARRLSAARRLRLKKMAALSSPTTQSEKEMSPIEDNAP